MRALVRLWELGVRLGEDGFYECRHCGTIVESASETCPACCSEEIARIDLR
ncbi:rubrerythrin [Halarchaeum solikamskense]|uniref:hypothetical protein n=1 Tax=Halarchaeum nitratireducens TaxID=489913 RepID=UPI001B3ACD2F|nr:hypothetical protein [Halarchaeum solikamskense]MBP2252653.1 rubrerythrin [Halarchaeum solikamskense]